MSVVIVCGSRTLQSTRANKELLRVRLEEVGATVVRHGDYHGADKLADKVAREMGLEVDLVPADWDTHGISAGPRRNSEMLARDPKPTHVLWFSGGRGTADMVRKGRSALGKDHVLQVDGDR